MGIRRLYYRNQILVVLNNREVVGDPDRGRYIENHYCIINRAGKRIRGRCKKCDLKFLEEHDEGLLYEKGVRRYLHKKSVISRR